jgi:pSer/pThr/pTyr-binding forkhead associated (FHA) protein
VIKLTLLQPNGELPIQQWTFDVAEKISIGRSSRNEVVLYSAVVSRQHITIIRDEHGDWILKNLGTNGTFIEGNPIDEILVYNGMIIRLAGTGPQIQINTEQNSEALNRQIARMINPDDKFLTSRDTDTGEDDDGPATTFSVGRMPQR